MNTKKCAAVFLVPMMLVGLSAHTAMVRVEFEGKVDFILDNSLLPGVSLGDVITGYYDVDTDVAPADLNNDPNIGEYSVFAPTPNTFIKATAVIGCMSFHSTDFDIPGGNHIDVQDNWDISPEERYHVLALSLDSPVRRFNMEVFAHHFDPQVFSMLRGDSIEQNFDWTSIIKPGSNIFFGYFSYHAGDTTAIDLSFGITKFKVGSMQSPPPPPPPAASVFMPWLPLLLE